MSLDFDYSRVQDSTSVMFEDVPAHEDDATCYSAECAADNHYMSVMRSESQTLIFATMTVGMGSITGENAAEFYTRCKMAGVGTYIDNDVNGHGLAVEIARHIGLRTNVSPESWTYWSRKMRARISDDYDRKVQASKIWSIDLDQCQTWRELDTKHDTPEDSPLHHDNRCTLCR